MTPDPTNAELDEAMDGLKKRLNYGKDEADLDQLGELLEAYEALRACRRQYGDAVHGRAEFRQALRTCRQQCKAHRQGAQDAWDAADAMEEQSKAKDEVVEAARKLEYEIDQTYDVDDGKPNYPFGAEWQDIKLAIAALDKETND